MYLKKIGFICLLCGFNLACSLTDLDYGLTDRTVTDKKEDNNEDKALESDGIEGGIVKEKTEESAKASTNGETAEAYSEDVKAPTSDTVKEVTVKAPASKVDDEKVDGMKTQASDKDGETKEDDKTETSDEDAETKEDKKTEASGEDEPQKTDVAYVEGKDEGMETDKEASATAKTGLDRYCSDSNLLVSVSSSY